MGTQQPLASESVEITEEMVRAGLDVFWMHDPDGDSPRDTVIEIFTVMVQVSQQSRSQARQAPQERQQSIDTSP